MSCKDCAYYDLCPLGAVINGALGTCLKFKNRADFVEVVRCKDCRWWNEAGCAIHIVDETDKPGENDFCSFGERKSDNE